MIFILFFYQFTTLACYTFNFLKYSFANYKYAGFQFLEHGKCAQRLCISNFQSCFLKKNLQSKYNLVF